jgi:hypothetical protein
VPSGRIVGLRSEPSGGGSPTRRQLGVPPITIFGCAMLLAGCCLDPDRLGSSGAMGATGGTAGATTAGSGSASGGAVDSGCFPADGYRRCGSDRDCSCGQWCVYDPFLIGSSGGVCESPCRTSSDCLNAAALCTDVAMHSEPSDVGKTCTINGCSDGGPGTSCDAIAGVAGSGTCVPYGAAGLDFGAQLELCVPNGTATTCLEGATNDDPFFRRYAVIWDAGYLAEPQTRTTASFCGPGRACDAEMGVAGEEGTCEYLCLWSDAGDPCTAPRICVTQDPYEAWWGFCLPCGSSGSDGGPAATCIFPSDCCEQNCAFGQGTLGRCVPASF